MARIRKSAEGCIQGKASHSGWRIAVYIRLSREDGNDESLSVTNQKKIINEYLERFFEEEFTLVDHYVDDSAKIGLNQKDLNNKGADIVLFLFYIKNRFRTRSQKG